MTIAETPFDNTEHGSRADVRAVLTEALVGLGIDAQDVRDESTLHGDFELDSTETVQVALELTRHLGVRITLSDTGDPTVVALVEQVVEQTRAVSEPSNGAP